MKRKEYSEAKKLLQRVLTLSINNSHCETRRSALSHLATIHCYLKEYESALKAGQQLHSETGQSLVCIWFIFLYYICVGIGSFT